MKHATCGEDHFNCKCGSFVMPFGKYKGWTIEEIYHEDRGDSYLEWCVDNFDPGKARDFIESYLTRKS